MEPEEGGGNFFFPRWPLETFGREKATIKAAQDFRAKILETQEGQTGTQIKKFALLSDNLSLFGLAALAFTIYPCPEKRIKKGRGRRRRRPLVKTSLQKRPLLGTKGQWKKVFFFPFL